MFSVCPFLLWWLRIYIYPLYYYHHQIGSMNYCLLFRLRSWNNGVRCMSFYIVILKLLHVVSSATSDLSWKFREVQVFFMVSLTDRHADGWTDRQTETQTHRKTTVRHQPTNLPTSQAIKNKNITIGVRRIILKIMKRTMILFIMMIIILSIVWW